MGKTAPMIVRRANTIRSEQISHPHPTSVRSQFTVFNLINCKPYVWTGANFAIKWLALVRFLTPKPKNKAPAVAPRWQEFHEKVWRPQRLQYTSPATLKTSRRPWRSQTSSLAVPESLQIESGGPTPLRKSRMAAQGLQKSSLAIPVTSEMII